MSGVDASPKRGKIISISRGIHIIIILRACVITVICFEDNGYRGPCTIGHVLCLKSMKLWGVLSSS